MLADGKGGANVKAKGRVKDEVRKTGEEEEEGK